MPRAVYEKERTHKVAALPLAGQRLRLAASDRRKAGHIGSILMQRFVTYPHLAQWSKQYKQ